MNLTETPELSHAIETVKALLKGKTPGVFIMTLGCQQNEADSEKLLGMALAMGYRPTADPAQAELILVNTCAIREHAEQRALSIVGQYKHFKEANPQVIIGVCGCMSAEAHRVRQLQKSYPYVSFTMAPDAVHRLPELVAGALRRQKRRFVSAGESRRTLEGIPTKRALPHRAWVSIMYGCDNFCSYCIVPYVRGREASRDSRAIVAEVEGLLDKGCKEITLLGQNVNSYRSDCDFAGLLRRLATLPGEFLLRFMTSHPKDVPDELVATMAAFPDKIAPHFHLPLQSGSDRILQAMNRRYTAAHYLGVVEKLRRHIPGIALTTDIMVGFPGETDEDFADTLGLLAQVRFDMVYSFLFSPRTGTPAADMPDQVSAQTKAARMKALLALQDDISLDCARAYLGREVRVLVDGPSKNDRSRYSGRTDTNKLVHFEAEPGDIGHYLPLTITRADAFALYGERCRQKGTV
ncbi:MAG: tRNA (N6-isopentenyl adenosine(37)-C2)-methylthiotransferase MiaB [Eubacteriales bacterium]